MLRIRTAHVDECRMVIDFYDCLIDQMQNSEYHPQWKKGIYPTCEALQAAVERGEMQIGFLDHEPVAAMILNHDCNPDYVNVKWPTQAKPEEVLMIHLLGVMPAVSGRGLGREMVDYAIDYAKERRMKVIRLDVLPYNIPALKLYRHAGFAYIDTVRMFYEDTGRIEFDLYEYTLLPGRRAD